jgi:hypothetical protein
MRHDALMTTLRVELIGDPALLEPWYDAAGSQKDNLCGVYWADVAVQAFTDHRFIDEEDAALVAGTVVPEGRTDPTVSFPWHGEGPRGIIEPTWPYRLDLPTSTDDDSLGTSAHGVVRAINELAQGELEVMPLRSNEWTSNLVNDLIGCLAVLDEPRLLAIANVGTVGFETSLHSLSDLLAVVMSGAELPERAGDWDVGHFVSLAGLIHGPSGHLVIVRDTYRLLGGRGYHLQPLVNVAAALHRGGTAAGGVLVVGPLRAVAAARAAVEELGLIEELWDNGSPT